MDFANYNDYIDSFFSADDYSKEYFRSLAIVSHDGTVFWAPPTKFRSTCSVDVMYFPFDDQSCNFKLSSWMYDGYKVGEKKLENVNFLNKYFCSFPSALSDIIKLDS